MFRNPHTKPAIRSARKSRSNFLRSAEVGDHRRIPLSVRASTMGRSVDSRNTLS
jgi:hypothetical protein